MSSLTLIVGGTGAVGTHVTRALAGRPGVRALAHSDASADALRAAGLADVVRGDLGDPSSLPRAFAGVTRLFLLTPFTADQAARELAAVDAAGDRLERLVKLSVERPETIRFGRGHAVVEERLRGAPYPVTLLRPGAFMTNLLGQAPLIAAGRLVQPMGDAALTWVDPADVAAVAVAALTAPAPPAGDLVPTGPERLTFAQTAAALGRAAGREVTYVDPGEDAWRRDLLDAGLPPFYVEGLVDLAARYREGWGTGPTQDVARLAGRPPRGLEDWARAALVPALTPAGAPR